MRRTSVLTLALAGTAAGLLTVAGCGAGDSAAAQSVAVTATDTTCALARTDLPAGTTEFTVTNKGTKVTEFYVYGSDGSVKGEVEDIGPGVTRSLRADLKAGQYEAACKPGMTGDGIRTKLTVSG
ncbi:MAG TPA: cupredoxin domain-containing protein [Micromonosporaceae bacterium]